MGTNKRIIRNLINAVIIIVIMFFLAFIYNRILSMKEEQKDDPIDIIFSDIEKDNIAYLELYTIYGNHLNLNGYIEKSAINNVQLLSMDLILEDEQKNITTYELKYSESDDGKYEFYLSDNINEGINLDKIDTSKYYVFLQINGSFQDEVVTKTYSIKNISSYSSSEYYTVTQNDSNKKINISFLTYSKDKTNLDYIEFSVEDCILATDVYDIVIDAGHGGRDCGATYNGKNESDFTLEYSLALKKKLEENGYKVKLTRSKDEYVESYGTNGRAIVPYKTKAKLVLSIHLNSTQLDSVVGGVEVYAANNANLNLAKSFVDNIVNYTGTRYSVNSYARVMDGVYVRTYTEDEIEEAKEYAKDLEYEPYETLSTDTPYLFMIRETGGIMTKAYIDGRNDSIGDNPYHNSNISAEAYLLELGFINCQDDVDNLENNKEAYLNAIVDSINNNYK